MTPVSIYIAKAEGSRPAPKLPGDAVTRTFGIFGVKDSGKTTTARVLAEGIVRIGGHVVIFDPVGVWWGITRAGEGKGLPGIVIGGEHGDVPLEETGGQLVAELCVARQWPVVVVDLKLLRKGAAQRFMADCLEAIYFSNRRPLHLMFEEADRVLPQTPRGMNPVLGRVMGAAEDIVKLGRSRGLGATFISQRMATVTKNVTEQMEALFVHAQVGTNDRKAVREFLDGQGDPNATAKVMETVASLRVGEAWLYSPKWLRVLERVRIKMPKTLDSSSTPTDDERDREEAAARAPVDLDELRRLMADTVERAAENDPAALRARVEELEAALASEVAQRDAIIERRLAEAAVPETVDVVVPDPALMAELSMVVAALDSAENEMMERLGTAIAAARDARDGITSAVREIGGVWAKLDATLDRLAALPREGVRSSDGEPARAGRGGTPPVRGDRAEPKVPAPANGALRRGERAMLAALAEYPARLSLAQWGVLAHRHGTSKPLAPSGSTFKTYHRVLRRHGLVEDGEPVAITDAGRRALDDPPAELKAEELREAWLGLLRQGERDILLRALQVSSWVSEETVAERVGIPASGSTFKTYVRVLARLDLIMREGGRIRAAEFLR